MWAHALIEGGLSIAKGFASYGASKAQYQAQQAAYNEEYRVGMIEAAYRRKVQAYNNAMVGVANALNQNALTSNQVQAVDRSTAQGFAIERARDMQLAEAEVSAAATGTAGRSVNQTLNTLNFSANLAQSDRLRDLDAQLKSIEQQRLNSEIQAEQSRDYSLILDPVLRSAGTKPSAVSAMLGIATDLGGVGLKYSQKPKA